MRLRLWTALLALSVLAPVALAQESGVIGPAGVAITPAAEGNLLVLYPNAKGHDGATVYTLVKTGGKAVVVMTPEGIALTPEEAWDTYGHGPRRPKPAPATDGPRAGTFSIPNTPTRHF